MCRAKVDPEAEQMLADLLWSIAAALEPDAPESVLIGPVDFGSDE